VPASKRPISAPASAVAATSAPTNCPPSRGFPAVVPGGALPHRAVLLPAGRIVSLITAAANTSSSPRR